MLSPELNIRKAAREDLDFLLNLAAGEGWNPGYHDADAYWAADPDGFLIVEKADKTIGGGSVVAYDARIGFMGLFIIIPEARGHGAGGELWHYRRDLLKSRLGPEGSIGLDGVEHMQHFYAAGGFVFQHSTTRFVGPIKAVAPEDSDCLVPLESVPFEEIAAFDLQHFGVPREAFLKKWFNAEGTKAFAAFDDSGKIRGLGSIRPGRKDGYRIGPLFANDAQSAENLLFALTQHTGDSNVYMDVPHINPDGMALVQRYNLQKVFTCGRMILGPPPALPWQQIYSVASFELG